MTKRPPCGGRFVCFVVPPVGVEPTIVGLKVRCLNQLGHRGVERHVTGLPGPRRRHR